MSPTTTDRELLSAYLDGELSATDARAFEARLAVEPALRDELRELEQVWGALDALPRVEVTDEFARTTIAMVAVEAENDAVAATMAMPKIRRRRGWTLAGIAAAAAVVGFLLAYGAGARRERMLLDHLPVVYQNDALQEFQEVRFLEKLPAVAPSLLAEIDQEQVNATAQTWLTIAQGDRATRRDWIDSLAPDDKAKLLEAGTRFVGLPASRRQQARAAYEDLVAAPDTAELQRTLLAYQSWLATLPTSEQLRLREMKAEERLAALAEINGRVARDHRLSADEGLALAAAAREVAGTEAGGRLARAIADRREAFLAGRDDRPPGDDRRRGEFDRGRRMFEQLRSEPAYAIVMLGVVALSPENSMMQRWFRRDWRQTREQAVDDWQAVKPTLVAALDADTRERLGELDDRRQTETLLRWLGEALRASRRNGDLEALFASDALTDAERFELLSLPRGEFEAALEDRLLGPELGPGPPGRDRRREPLRGPRRDPRGGFEGPRRGGPPPASRGR